MELKDEVHILGLVVVRKLSWKSNNVNRMKKHSIVLYACKKGRNWGHRMTHGIFKAVVETIDA